MHGYRVDTNDMVPARATGRACRSAGALPGMSYQLLPPPPPLERPPPNELPDDELR